MQPCDHLLGTANPLALLCVVFCCVLSLSHVVSWVECGTLLYRFLIFASFLTLLILTNVRTVYFSAHAIVIPDNVAGLTIIAAVS